MTPAGSMKEQPEATPIMFNIFNIFAKWFKAEYEKRNGIHGSLGHDIYMISVDVWLNY